MPSCRQPGATDNSSSLPTALAGGVRQYSTGVWAQLNLVQAWNPQVERSRAAHGYPGLTWHMQWPWHESSRAAPLPAPLILQTVWPSTGLRAETVALVELCSPTFCWSPGGRRKGYPMQPSSMFDQAAGNLMAASCRRS